MVENFNSRLRNYFTLRRQLDGEYLSLLQFCLNHRTFLRSRVPDRVNISAHRGRRFRLNVDAISA
jgi:hypothetical protein